MTHGPLTSSSPTTPAPGSATVPSGATILPSNPQRMRPWLVL